jgi:hypothetical protein
VIDMLILGDRKAIELNTLELRDLFLRQIRRD